MSELFIPKKIRVGFQKRKDTYTNKLAYVIYYDAKGKLRKEKSWQSWRDHGIKAEEFDNKPQDGFHLNKDIQRFNWGHFGSNRSYIRIYDSRGIEFEITPENLVGLLTETTCSQRGLDGEFVYAWVGPELVLLPCGSEDYAKAVAHTELQSKKVSARDLKPGCSYRTKKDKEVIYIGRFFWLSWDRYSQKSRISQKRHIFAHPKGTKDKWNRAEPTFFPHDASFLAELNSEDPVSDYAELVDKFNGDVHSSVIEKWEIKPLKLKADTVFAREKNNAWSLKRTDYTEMDGDNVIFWELVIVRGGHWHNESLRGYELEKLGTLNTKPLLYTSDRYYRHTHYGIRDDNNCSVFSEEQMLVKLATFVEVSAVLSSGKKLRMRNIGDIAVD